MKKDTYEEFATEKCPQDINEDGHLIQRKWDLPDRECFKCKTCGKEIIVFNNENEMGNIIKK